MSGVPDPDSTPCLPASELQGDGAKTQAAVTRVQNKNVATVPWSVNARTEDDMPEEEIKRAEELESEEEMECLPYCIMPYVERLLQVCPFGSQLK